MNEETEGHKLYKAHRICRICETKPCSENCNWVKREYPSAYTGPANHSKKELRELAKVTPIACIDCNGGK